MLRVHVISDRNLLPPSLRAIERPLPGRPAMPGPGTITPHPSDTPGLVPGTESPMPRTDTPGLPGALPDPSAPAHSDDPATRPDMPDPGDVPDPGASLPGGGVTVPEEEIPDAPQPDTAHPTAVPIPGP